MSFVPGTHFYRQKTKYTKPAPNPVPTLQSCGLPRERDPVKYSVWYCGCMELHLSSHVRLQLTHPVLTPHCRKLFAMTGQLQNKVACITGASRGVGAEIARVYAREGASVVVNYFQSKDKAQAVVDGIVAAGGKAIAAYGAFICVFTCVGFVSANRSNICAVPVCICVCLFLYVPV